MLLLATLCYLVRGDSTLLQILFPGLLVLLKHPSEAMAVPALTLTFLVTAAGIRRTPAAWLNCARCDQDGTRMHVAVSVFTKICIVFLVYTVRAPSACFALGVYMRHILARKYEKCWHAVLCTHHTSTRQ